MKLVPAIACMYNFRGFPKLRIVNDSAV